MLALAMMTPIMNSAQHTGMEALEELEESKTQTSEVPSTFLKITAATSICITQETGRVDKAANLQTNMEA